MESDVNCGLAVCVYNHDDGHVQEYHSFSLSLSTATARIRDTAMLWPSHRLQEEATPSPKPPYDTHPPTRARRRKEVARQ